MFSFRNIHKEKIIGVYQSKEWPWQSWKHI